MVFTRKDGDFHGRAVSFREGICQSLSLSKGQIAKHKAELRAPISPKAQDDPPMHDICYAPKKMLRRFCSCFLVSLLFHDFFAIPLKKNVGASQKKIMPICY